MTAYSLTQCASWRALERHRARIESTTLRSLFDEDDKRAERFTVDAAGLHCDFSKQRINQETLQ